MVNHRLSNNEYLRGVLSAKQLKACFPQFLHSSSQLGRQYFDTPVETGITKTGRLAMKNKPVLTTLFFPLALSARPCSWAAFEAPSPDQSQPAVIGDNVLPKNKAPLFGSEHDRHLSILQKTREDGKRQAAQAAYELGVAAKNRNDLGVAEQLFAEAALLQPDNVVFLQAASRTAFALKKHKAVEIYLLKLLGMYRTGTKTDPNKQLEVMDNLATLYQAQGRTSASKAILREGISIRQRLYGDSNPGLIDSHYRLAALELASSNLSEAKLHLKAAISIVDSATETLDEADIAAVYHNIGELYRASANYDDARRAYQKSLTLWNKSPEKNRQSIAATTRSLTRLRVQKAEAEIARINAIPENALPRMSPVHGQAGSPEQL